VMGFNEDDEEAADFQYKSVALRALRCRVCNKRVDYRYRYHPNNCTCQDMEVLVSEETSDEERQWLAENPGIEDDKFQFEDEKFEEDKFEDDKFQDYKFEDDPFEEVKYEDDKFEDEKFEEDNFEYMDTGYGAFGLGGDEYDENGYLIGVGATNKSSGSVSSASSRGGKGDKGQGMASINQSQFSQNLKMSKQAVDDFEHGKSLILTVREKALSDNGRTLFCRECKNRLLMCMCRHAHQKWRQETSDEERERLEEEEILASGIDTGFQEVRP
jgi:hypothetical protein